jgi:hypothetical protein
VRMLPILTKSQRGQMCKEQGIGQFPRPTRMHFHQWYFLPQSHAVQEYSTMAEKVIAKILLDKAVKSIVNLFSHAVVKMD